MKRNEYYRRQVLLAPLVLLPACQRASQEPSTTRSKNTTTAVPQIRSPQLLSDTLQNGLVKAGWRASTASQVAQLNHEFLEAVYADEPELLAEQVKRLARLSDYPSAMLLLRKRPELSGLLAAATDPEQLVRLFANDATYATRASLFVSHAGRDADAFAQALTRHGLAICRLHERGIPGADGIFIFQRTTNTQRYDDWLAAVFESALTLPDEDLAAMVQFVLVQGSEIRQLVKEEADFGAKLLAEIWPKLERLVHEDYLTWEQATWDLNLLPFLRRPQAEKLVRKWGLLPITLLHGDDKYPDSLHSDIIATLMAGDEATLAALMRFGKEPLFRDLLSNSTLGPQERAQLFGQLWGAGDGYHERLTYFSRLSDSALAEEVGPLPDGLVTWVPLYYTVYEVPKKMMQGRNPTVLDITIAVADPAFILLGPLGPDDALKVVGKTGLTSLGKRTAGQAVTQTLRHTARQTATRQIGRKAAEKLTQRELAPWIFRQMLTQFQRTIRAKIARAATVDVTGPVRFFYKALGVGRETFRRMTQLEARIFMRADRRILIHVDRILTRGLAARFLAETAVAGLAEVSLSTNAARDALVGIRDGTDYVRERVDHRVGLAQSKFSAWQKNVSAWWLMNTATQQTELNQHSGDDDESKPTE